MSEFRLSNRVKIVNPSANVDKAYGPYESVELAFDAILPTAAQGKTVGVIVAGSVVEYWFKDAPTGPGGVYVLADLVEKQTAGAPGPEVRWVKPTPVPNPVGGFAAGQNATPAEGLTFQEFANKLLFPALPPTITGFGITTAKGASTYDVPTSNTFWLNQPAGSVSFAGNWAAQTVGAASATVTLQFRRGSGSWATHHTANVAATSGNINAFPAYTFAGVDNTTLGFRLIVTDDLGGTITTSELTAQFTNPNSGNAVFTGSAAGLTYQHRGTVNVASVAGDSSVQTNIIPGRTVTLSRVYDGSGNVAAKTIALEYSTNGTTWTPVGAGALISANPNTSGPTRPSWTVFDYTVNDAALTAMGGLVNVNVTKLMLRLAANDGIGAITYQTVYNREFVYPVYASTVSSGVETIQTPIPDNVFSAPSAGTSLANSYLLAAGNQVVAIPLGRFPVTSIWIPNIAGTVLEQASDLLSVFDAVNVDETRTFNGITIAYKVFRKNGVTSARNVQFRK